MNSKDQLEEMLDAHMTKEAPEEARQAMAAELNLFKTRLAALERYPEPRAPWLWSFLRPALAVALAGFAFLAVTAFLPAPKPTWAQVMESLASVQDFGATIYVTASNGARSVRLELSMTPDGRMSLLAGDETVVFAPDGAATVTQAPGVSAPDENMRAARLMVQAVLERLRSVDGFTFDELVAALRGTVNLTTPSENMKATISPDLAVFDMRDDTGAERIRIHALRKSRLPMRVFYQDVREGIQVDAILTYDRPALDSPTS